GEVPGGLLHGLAAQAPNPDLAQVAEPPALPDRPGLDAEREPLRRPLVLLVERLQLTDVDSLDGHAKFHLLELDDRDGGGGPGGERAPGRQCDPRARGGTDGLRRTTFR